MHFKHNNLPLISYAAKVDLLALFHYDTKEQQGYTSQLHLEHLRGMFKHMQGNFWGDTSCPALQIGRLPLWRHVPDPQFKSPVKLPRYPINHHSMQCKLAMLQLT